MWRLGINLQRISLGTLIIALGLLVDDAIIVVEMMQVKMEHGLERFKAASFAWTSTAFPMLTGTLITATDFVPVGFALLVSWLDAVLFIPYLGTKLLPDIKPHVGEKDFDAHARFHHWFSGEIAWCVAHRKRVLATTAAAFVVSLIAFQFVPKQFFPDSPSEEILIDVHLPEGASYAATLAETENVEQLLCQDSRVRDTKFSQNKVTLLYNVRHEMQTYI